MQPEVGEILREYLPCHHKKLGKLPSLGINSQYEIWPEDEANKLSWKVRLQKFQSVLHQVQRKRKELNGDVPLPSNSPRTDNPMEGFRRRNLDPL